MKQHKTKQGFILVEWMIYSTLLIFVSMITYTHVVAWHQHMSRVHRMLADALPIYLATDMMRSDILHTANDSLEIKNGTLILHHTHKHITWGLHKQNLVRTSGTYDVQLKRWRKPVKSLVAPGMESGSFAQDKDGQLHMQFKKLSTIKPLTVCVCLRNGHAL